MNSSTARSEIEERDLSLILEPMAGIEPATPSFIQLSYFGRKYILRYWSFVFDLHFRPCEIRTDESI